MKTVTMNKIWVGGTLGQLLIKAKKIKQLKPCIGCFLFPVLAGYVEFAFQEETLLLLHIFCNMMEILMGRGRSSWSLSYREGILQSF